MKKLSTHQKALFVTTFLLQACLTTTAVYGIMFEVPRTNWEKVGLVALCVVAATITFMLTIQKIVSETRKDKKIDDMLKLAFTFNTPLSDAATEKFARACSSMGCGIGLSRMAVRRYSEEQLMAFKRDDDSDSYEAFVRLGREEAREIILDAETLEYDSIKKSCKAFYMEKIAFDSDDQFVSENIKNFILSVSKVFGWTGEAIFNSVSEDQPVLRVVLGNDSTSSNQQHVGMVVMDGGRKMMTYDVFKDQVDSLVGLSRFAASERVIKWFEEAGFKAVL